MTKKVVIDAGHGDQDPGAVGNGLKEKNLTLEISKLVKKHLEDNYSGVSVKMTRTKDEFLALSKRADIANDYGADVFISNHINAGGGTGYESFIYTSTSANTKKLQKAINEQAVKAAKKHGLGTHGNENKTGNLAVVRETKMPAVLTEMAFIDKDKDAKLLKDEDFLNEMASAYADGIASYLGLSKKSGSTTQSKKTTTTSKSGTLYKVQVGAFSKKDNADDLVAELKKKGYEAIVTKE